MKLTLKTILTLVLAGTLTTGCSDEEKMPANPDIPVAAAPASDMIIYEANPRLYATDNCIPALTARLDDIKALGITVLWVMPVNTPGEKNAVGSPYCVRDFKGMNPKYGTLADFKALVNAAHSKGILVILDWIANHTSWDNAWITDHPDWYTHDASGNIISPAGMGWDDVADLNYDNAEMRTAMIDAMKYWVTEAGIDGFRCDHADGVPHDFWADAIAQLRGIRADLLMLAETSDADFFNDGFDMFYGWSFASKLKDLFAGKLTCAGLCSESNKEMAKIPEGKQVLRYAVNHDTASESSLDNLYGGEEATIAAYVVAAMMDGIPMIYSSQETDYRGTMSFFNYNPLTWPGEHAPAYSAINAAYKASAAVRGGELRSYENGRVATFARVSGENAVLVMVNTSATETEAKVPISFAGTAMTDLIAGDSEAMPVSVNIPAYGYRIWMK